jgi:glycosyltransferase involved in cell wall biosynthesis
VLHIITRMIVGGAQETALLICALGDHRRYRGEILTGPETGPEGELHQLARQRGVPLHFEPLLVRRVDPMRDIAALFRIARFIRLGGYDVVHTHSSKAGVLGRLAARLAGVRTVVHTVHGWGFTGGSQGAMARFFVLLERCCAPLCGALVTVSTTDRDLGLELRIGQPDQYRCIRSGIEVELYADVSADRVAVRRELGLPADAFVIGSVARLSPQKAPLDMIEAFARVARETPHAHLVMVGDGPLREQVEQAIASRGLTERAHLLGLRHDVPTLLRAFDALALSSRWEGLPRVFPQAMAAGLPIVATRVAGASDAIVPGENGCLVDVGDMVAMGAALVALAADPDAARRMGARGRERVDEFSARRMLTDIEELYDELDPA